MTGTWYTFETIRPDGSSDLMERTCNERQMKLQAARMAKYRGIQTVAVFLGRKDGDGALVWQKQAK